MIRITTWQLSDTNQKMKVLHIAEFEPRKKKNGDFNSEVTTFLSEMLARAAEGHLIEIKQVEDSGDDGSWGKLERFVRLGAGIQEECKGR